MQAPETVQGKRVRCKGCGHAFEVPAAKGAAAQPASAKKVSEEESYGIIKEDESIPRCPHCAKEMSSAEAVICIHCGFNTVTRQRAGTRKVIETTGGEHLAWLMPGILCVVTIVTLIVLDLLFCFKVPAWVKNSDYDWLDAKPLRVWGVIASLFLMFFCGQFAFRRLILNPRPPEREKDI
jgi:ribosomal protein L37E